jgi:hypothetical protein
MKALSDYAADIYQHSMYQFSGLLVSVCSSAKKGEINMFINKGLQERDGNV